MLRHAAVRSDAVGRWYLPSYIYTGIQQNNRERSWHISLWRKKRKVKRH